MGIRRRLLLQSVESKLDLVLNRLSILEEKLVALADDFKAGIAQLNTETNAVAALITALTSKITNSMSDADVATIKAGFATLSDRLTTLAVDPTQPVPPPPAPLQALKAGK